MTKDIVIEFCHVKSIRADLVAGRVNITFSAALDAEMLEARPHLAFLAFEDSAVTLTIREHQMSLPLKLDHDPKGVA